MKNWSIWIDNFAFILALGVITFMDDIHRMTGISVRLLIFFTGVTIVFSGIKSIAKKIAFFKNPRK